MNVWLPDGSHPAEATTLADTTEFQDFRAGHGYEREMPLDIPVKEVVDTVLAPLPAQEKPSVLVSCPPYDKPGSPCNGVSGFVMPLCSLPYPQHHPARQRKRSTPAMTKPTNPYVQAYSDFLGGTTEHQAQQAETPEAVPA
ncbi:hypothetical protein AB0E04_17305 [Streptomyces sp. NPDC048251]|uniref:hypothetical protein n=1 Tax=Streptomyces sp. NPDC048251 TaxID=3154501 RepID=UPI003446FBE1